MNNNEKITVIMISHDLSTVSEYATKILHIRDNDYIYADVADYKTTLSGVDIDD